MKLKQKNLLAVCAALLITMPIYGASGTIKFIDEAGHMLETKTIHGADYEIVPVHRHLSNVDGRILYVSQEQLVLKDDGRSEVLVKLASPSWNQRWYPRDYEKYWTWNDKWNGYYFPSYQETAAFWHYDTNAYARYVAHWDGLRHNHDAAKLRSDWLKEGEILKTAVYPKYVIGFQGSKFEPERLLTRAEATAMFSRLVAGDQPIVSEDTGYTDIEQGAWYYDFVGFASARGLTIANPGEAFKPDEPISSKDFNQLLAKTVEILGMGVVRETAQGQTVTRIQAIDLINNNTGRIPDHGYITENLASPFVDVLANTLAYDQLVTAATTYMESTWQDGLVGWSFHTH